MNNGLIRTAIEYTKKNIEEKQCTLVRICDVFELNKSIWNMYLFINIKIQYPEYLSYDVK